jgi:hypothetical protein
MFAYCGNNPVNRSDPSGHFWKEILSLFDSNTNSVSGSFQEGIIRGSGSLTGGYSEFMLRGQAEQQLMSDSGKDSVSIGFFTKVSGGNCTGKIGIGNSNISLSAKGVGDVLTTTAQAGVKYQKGFGLIAKGKAAVFSGRATLELELFGWQIELGVTGDAISVGAGVTIGVFVGAFETTANASLGVGGGFVFRIKPPQ